MFLSRFKHRTPGKGANGGDPNSRLVTVVDPAGACSEAYRSMRANLLYGFIDSPPRVIVVTSPGRGEGKTTTCANLGVVLAQAENNTLIVDCDLRGPGIHKAFGLRNMYGIVDVLGGELDLQEACHVPVPGLQVLTAGPIPPNSAEFLSSTRFAKFVDEVRTQFDYVLIDTPPAQSVSDSTVVAPHGDGVVLVLDAQNTRKGKVRQTVRRLEAVGTRILGTVMNNAKVPRSAYYEYVYEG